VDQLLDMLVVALLVPAAVGYFGASVSGSYLWGLLALLLAGVAVGAGALVARERFASAAAEALRLGRRSLGVPFALAVATTLLYFGTLGLVARAVGLGVGVVALSLATVAAGVVEMAPITVAGLGTREAALLALLAPFHVEPQAVVAMTLIVRALQVGTGAAAYAAGAGAVIGLEGGATVAPGAPPAGPV
jgi:uncharacterized membrane protein YbhN (UPF0104 family)